MRLLLIGFGEIGRALHANMTANLTAEIHAHDPNQGYYADCQEEYDFAHITVPVGDSGRGAIEDELFCNMIYNYVKEFIYVKTWVIHSSISLGIAEKLTNFLTVWKEVQMIYVPMNGTHGRLEWEIIRYPLTIGQFRPESNKEYLERYFQSIGFRINQWVSVKEAALGKLVDVCWYGINIAFVQEIWLLCQREKLDFSNVYNQYAKPSMIQREYDPTGRYGEEIPRPIFFPGVVGGKCVIQDEKLLIPSLTDPSLLRRCISVNDEMKVKKQ
jgi:UDP-N-acetyl-D-mannosaminuronate dehydrogenase